MNLPLEHMLPTLAQRLEVPSQVTLAERMRAHEACCFGSELERHAQALEGLQHDTPVREMLGVWARARRYWCELTGEVLV